MTVWVLKHSNAQVAEAMFKYCFFWTAADGASPSGLESALWGYNLPIGLHFDSFWIHWPRHLLERSMAEKM